MASSEGVCCRFKHFECSEFSELTKCKPMGQVGVTGVLAGPEAGPAGSGIQERYP